MKTHLYHYPTEHGMPFDLIQEYQKEGRSGTLCGYMRKTTNDPQEVTCFYCKKKMKREGK